MHGKTLSLNIPLRRVIQADQFHLAPTALGKFANPLARPSHSRRKRCHHMQQPGFLCTHSLCQDTSRDNPCKRREPGSLK